MRMNRVLRSYVLLLVTTIFLVGSLTAQNNKKSSSSPPPKPAPAAKAAPARPSSVSGASGGARSATPGNGPTANHVPSGPTANHPSGPTANHPPGGSPVHAGGPGPSGPHPGSNPGGPHEGGPDVRTSRESTGSRGIGGQPMPADARVTHLKGGSAIQHDAHGRVTDVHDAHRGMDVHNGLGGRRSVSVERPDHTRIFAERGRPGYIQHPYNFHGRDFARRSYYYHGHAYERFYRSYGYRGFMFDVYAPRYYYGPGFYGWVYNPWYQPVVYGWGWGGAAWAGYYGFYFAPAPSYPSAAFWLTDYMISQDLAANYQAAQDSGTAGAAQSSGGAAELTPAVKQQIADEVKYQVATENAEAQQNGQSQDQNLQKSSIEQLLTDGKTHTFVTGGDLDVADRSGGECALSGGDVLELTAPPAPDAQTADLVVLASKGGQECGKSHTVTVAFADLQEMQNHMRETIDQGLQELQSKQGTGGLPAAPPSARTAPVETAFAQGAPAPDPNGAAEVNQQLQQADAAVQDVTAQGQQETASSGEASAPAAPVNIALGQSIDQVTGALGQPMRIVDLGAKKIYQYRDMKITFRDGKVADVE